jgi:hypothetical protein
MRSTPGSHGDDRVELLDDGRVRLACAAPKGWTPRRPKSPTSSEHPGTAVSWDGGVFEVLEASAYPSGGVAYVLAPWEERHTVRVFERYDAESEARRLEERRRREGALARGRASIWLAPLLGHLPASVQSRMETEFGAPARGMTIASALPLLVLGALGLLGFLLDALGGGGALAGWPVLPLPWSLYLFVESALRLGIAFVHGEPAGSLAGWIVYGIWSGLRRQAPGPPPGYASRPAPPAREEEEEEKEEDR